MTELPAFIGFAEAAHFLPGLLSCPGNFGRKEKLFERKEMVDCKLEVTDPEAAGAGSRPVLLTPVGLRPPSVSKTDLRNW